MGDNDHVNLFFMNVFFMRFEFWISNHLYKLVECMRVQLFFK